MLLESPVRAPGSNIETPVCVAGNFQAGLKSPTPVRHYSVAESLPPTSFSPCGGYSNQELLMMKMLERKQVIRSFDPIGFFFSLRQARAYSSPKVGLDAATD